MSVPYMVSLWTAGKKVIGSISMLEGAQCTTNA